MKRNLQLKEIEIMIDELINILAAEPIKSDQALRIQHEHHLYAECVRELLALMRLPSRVKVKMYPDKLWPHKPGSAAKIFIPATLPFLYDPAYQKIVFQIDIRESHTREYIPFLIVTVHELAHLLLHSLQHNLRKSEIATDLVLIVLGFGDIVKQAYNGQARLGYLDYQEFDHALIYFKKRQLQKNLFNWR